MGIESGEQQTAQYNQKPARDYKKQQRKITQRIWLCKSVKDTLSITFQLTECLESVFLCLSLPKSCV